MAPPKLSVVVPLFNEEQNVLPLKDAIVAALEPTGWTYEVILVDDGSSDSTPDLVRHVAAADAHFHFISLRRNAGQTAALMAGFDHARGELVVPMDGDLQNDPLDIPRLVGKLEEGYDVVSGWRKDRQDATLSRTLPSRIANLVISRVTGVSLHDYGCTLKAYRREYLEGVRLYGEMHRFIPIYAYREGARVTEIPVTHHARKRGVSKYGLERIHKVVLDLLVVSFLGTHLTKPIYVFGGFGILCIAISVTIVLLTIWLRLFKGVYMIQTPLLLLAVMLFITGVMNVLQGILAELVVRTYFESQQKSVYAMGETSMPAKKGRARRNPPPPPSPPEA